MLRRQLSAPHPPVSLLDDHSYVFDSHIPGSYEGNQAGIAGGLVTLLITRFTGRQRE